MSFTRRYEITPRYLRQPSRRRSGLAMSPGVRFVVCHDTGNPRSTASANVRYYDSTPNAKPTASAHLFVDDREIIECIPALTSDKPEKAWHVLYDRPNDNLFFGHNANDAAIGIEYCYGGRIDADAAYDKFVWTIAFACHKYGLDPRIQITGHCFLDPPPRKTDPVSGLAHSRRTYDQLLRDVVDEVERCTGTTLAPLVRPVGPKRVTMKMNLRRGEPRQRAPVHRVAAVGTLIEAVAMRTGDPVNGNPVWFEDANGNYFWSGAVVAAPT